jgi:hypothetical protein
LQFFAGCTRILDAWIDNWEFTTFTKTKKNDFWLQYGWSVVHLYFPWQIFICNDFGSVMQTLKFSKGDIKTEARV